MRNWLIHLVLLAWPRDWRDRHGRAFAQTLSTHWTAPGGGRLSRTVTSAADAVLAGLSERRARTRAARGALDPTVSRTGAAMSSLRADLHLALRALRRRPTFVAAVVATLALGLGASAAMFSVVNAVLLRPLPFPDDGRLVMMTERHATRPVSGASFPAFQEWRTFPELASVGAYETRSLTFTIDGAPQRFEGASVSPDFFRTLGVSAVLGRTTQPGEPLLDADRKIVLSRELWMRGFGGDAGAIGRTIEVERVSYTIIGVMPAGVEYPSTARFWVTLPPNMSRVQDERSLRFLSVIGRLKPAADVRSLQDRLAAWVSARPRLADDRDAASWKAEAIGMKDAAIAGVRPALVVVFAGVGLLLLVACASVAALVMAHGRARLRDFAVQASLGAGRERIVRQLLLEGLLLSLAGAAVAVLIAGAARDAIVALSLNQIPRIEQVQIDGRVLAFVLLAGIVTTLVVALGPAFALTRSSNHALARDTSRTTAGSAGGHRFFGALVTLEFALALTLVAGAGLLTNSYLRLRDVDTGLQPGNVGVARVTMPLTPAWRGDQVQRPFYDDVRARVQALPGIDSSAIVTRLPLEVTRGSAAIWPEGDKSRELQGLIEVSSEDYFKTIGATIVDGRDFDAHDIDTNPVVVVVNDVVANRLWPGERAVGRSIEFQYLVPMKATVVGVVRAVRYDGLTSALKPELYLSFRQGVVLPMYLVYRASAPPLSMVAGIRSALSQSDPTKSVTLDDISTLDQKFAIVVARPRFYLVLVGMFAAFAFVLATLGIYGTLSFWTNERRREMGIRLALGAQRGQITSLVVRRGLTSAGIGIAAGLAATIAAGRFTSALLFGVGPSDPATLAAAAALLLAVAAVASVLPARRATRVNPLEILRAE